MKSSIRPLAKAERATVQSWTSLVATTSGLDDFGRVRVCVRASVGELEGFRLVVQSYRTGDSRGGLPSLYQRPLSAAQRAVDSDQLERGVEVVLVHSGASIDDEGCVVVAWIEKGAPDLDYDGLTARPADAVYVGMCYASSERAQVVLERAAA